LAKTCGVGALVSACSKAPAMVSALLEVPPVVSENWESVAIAPTCRLRPEKPAVQPLTTPRLLRARGTLECISLLKLRSLQCRCSLRASEFSQLLVKLTTLWEREKGELRVC